MASNSSMKRTSSGNSTNANSLDGNKARKETTTSSPSASASASAGFMRLNYKLRSPLRSPLAVPLILLLNDDDGTGTKVIRDESCPLQKLYNDEKRNYDAIGKQGTEAFKEALKDWDGLDERRFTNDILLKKLENVWKSTKRDAASNTEEVHDSQGSAESETSARVKPSVQIYLTGINRGGEQRGSLDILLYEPNRQKENVACPISVIEVGRKGPYKWWQKIGQGHDYVSMMRNPTKNGGAKDHGIEEYHFDDDHPMLLSSVIIGKPKSGVSSEVSGDFGVFLCIPVHDADGKPSFRSILLWRKRIKAGEGSLIQASKAFGKIIQASQALYKWRTKQNGNLCFTYLGPNCAKVGDRLYRSYDTRIRPSDRSSALYLLSDFKNEGKKEDQNQAPSVGFHWYPRDNDIPLPDDGAKVVLEVSDGGASTTCETGKERLCVENDKEWIWENQGRLQMISVPYRHGGHVATKVSDFLPVLSHLQHLHKFDIVHGDIRAFNIVFGKEQGETGQKKAGWLIDLDFGGKAGVATYPNHYLQYLHDGHRCGEELKPLKKFDDYYALWNVISSVHRVIDPKADVNRCVAQTNLNDFFKTTENGKFDKWKDAKSKVGAFLSTYGDLEMEPALDFDKALSELGVAHWPDKKTDAKIDESPNKNANTNTQVATGSLKKFKIEHM